jgi:exonuclease SbcC
LHDQARTQQRSLIDQQNRHREAERQLDDAERNHNLHDRLAGLLGPDGIQLDLVRGAEGRIIARANEILVRLSSGELRFEPPDADSTRAFDLSVRRRDCPAPIAVGNLSGGQRFRVAVSLALAVCQGAGDGSRPLEAVIIDEGFGSLDREGRMAMIAELRDGQTLARMFKRVLVVSHQDDFASAFPVGYRLRSDGGTTMVEAFGISGDER